MNLSKRSSWCPIIGEAIAECFGTCILIVFGCGSVAQFVLSKGTAGSVDLIPWGFGFGIAFGVFTAGGISGGHINPAVTLAMCVCNKCEWKKLFPYWIGQYIGAFLGACIVYVLNYDSFQKFESGAKTLATAGIFGTFPISELSIWNGLADQVFGTAMLLFLIMALTDEKNMGPHKGYLPIFIGLAVTAIAMTYGRNGFAINPARDLSPRLFTLAAGWGNEVFSHNNYTWWWIPVLGPYLGGILGACTYVTFIQRKNPFSGIYPKSTDSSDQEVEAQSNNGSFKQDSTAM